MGRSKCFFKNYYASTGVSRYCHSRWHVYIGMGAYGVGKLWSTHSWCFFDFKKRSLSFKGADNESKFCTIRVYN